MKPTIIFFIFFSVSIQVSLSQSNVIAESRAFDFLDSLFAGRDKLIIRYIDFIFDKKTEEIGKKFQISIAKKKK